MFWPSFSQHHVKFCSKVSYKEQFTIGSRPGTNPNLFLISWILCPARSRVIVLFEGRGFINAVTIMAVKLKFSEMTCELATSHAFTLTCRIHSSNCFCWWICLTFEILQSHKRKLQNFCISVWLLQDTNGEHQIARVIVLTFWFAVYPPIRTTKDKTPW